MPPAESIWQALLSESASTRAPLPDRTSVVVVGDVASGKTSLVSRLVARTADDVPHGIALDYAYLDVRADDDDGADEVLSRVSFWQLEGDLAYKALLGMALKPGALAHSCAVICLDLSRPWDLLASLAKWTTLLEEHVQGVVAELPADERDALREADLAHFQAYAEPAAPEDGAPPRQRRVAQPAPVYDAQYPLPEGAMESALGIPLVVAVCKADAMAQLERTQKYDDNHFDFIQHALRKFCLSYGAALVYTSAKTNANCELLSQYLLHRLYKFPFEHPANVLNKRDLFVPTGWDTPAKIATVAEGLQGLPLDKPFQSVIAPPSSAGLAQAAGSEDKIKVEDDQAFLERHLKTLEKGGFVASEGDGDVKRQITKMLGKGGAAPKRGGAAGGAGNAGGSAGGSAGAAGEQGAATGDNQAVLSNFFNSLLKKDASPASPADARKDVEKELNRLRKGGGK